MPLRRGLGLNITSDMVKDYFSPSAAVVAFVKANRLAKSQGKEFGLCFANKQVRMILELTQLDRFVQVYEDEADFLGNRYELMAA